MFNYCCKDSDYMKLNLHGISNLQYHKCELNLLIARIYKKRKKYTLHVHDHTALQMLVSAKLRNYQTFNMWE